MTSIHKVYKVCLSQLIPWEMAKGTSEGLRFCWSWRLCHFLTHNSSLPVSHVMFPLLAAFQNVPSLWSYEKKGGWYYLSFCFSVPCLFSIARGWLIQFESEYKSSITSPATLYISRYNYYFKNKNNRCPCPRKVEVQGTVLSPVSTTQNPKWSLDASINPMRTTVGSVTRDLIVPVSLGEVANLFVIAELVCLHQWFCKTCNFAQPGATVLGKAASVYLLSVTHSSKA